MQAQHQRNFVSPMPVQLPFMMSTVLNLSHVSMSFDMGNRLHANQTSARLCMTFACPLAIYAINSVIDQHISQCGGWMHATSISACLHITYACRPAIYTSMQSNPIILITAHYVTQVKSTACMQAQISMSVNSIACMQAQIQPTL